MGGSVFADILTLVYVFFQEIVFLDLLWLHVTFLNDLLPQSTEFFLAKLLRFSGSRELRPFTLCVTFRLVHSVIHPLPLVLCKMLTEAATLEFYTQALPSAHV